MPVHGTVSCPVRGPDFSGESGAAGSQGAWSGSIRPSLSDFQQVTGVSGRTCVRKKSNTSIANLLRELRERARKTLWKAALCERVGAAPWFILALKLHPAFPSHLWIRGPSRAKFLPCASFVCPFALTLGLSSLLEGGGGKASDLKPSPLDRFQVPGQSLPL